MRYCFEDFVLDTTRHELRRNGLIVSAAPQVLDLLACLIQHRARIVTKDELVAAVWDGRAITDSALTTRLNMLRSAVGDSGQQQRLIKTLPRRGFRFLGDVREEPTPAHREESTLPSIAVLPFVNLSGSPSQDFLGDAIADEVLTELASLRWLRVIARNSSFTFRGSAADVRDIGRQLGVRYVLEGGAHHGSGRVRVACRLVDARTSFQVWSARYERKFTDLFGVQDEITDAVVAALAPAIIAAERERIARKAPESLSAWECCQRGVSHMLRHSPDDNLRARRFFQQAVAREPDYSPGHDGMAWIYLMEASAFGRMSVAEGCRRSEPLARRAIALDPNNAEARARLALAVHLTGENREGLTEAGRALDISPNCADAWGVRGAILVFAGDRKEGRASLEKHLALSPRDPARPIRLAQIAASHYFDKDYRRAAQVARQTVQQYPTIHFAYRWLAASLGQLGRRGAGAKVFASLKQACGPSVPAYARQRPPYYRADDYEHLMEGLAKAQ